MTEKAKSPSHRASSAQMSAPRFFAVLLVVFLLAVIIVASVTGSAGGCHG